VCELCARTAVAPSDGHLWVDDREIENEQRLTAAREVEHPTAEPMLVSNLATRAATQPTTPYRVYDGDWPSPYGTVCPDLTASAQAALDQAWTEPDGARRLLGLHTMTGRRRKVYKREIVFLQDNGVPAGFLPDGAELDRLFPWVSPALKE
jgi:hypothetical protein